MKLFELWATLGIDTEPFKQDVQNAEKTAAELSTALESASQGFDASDITKESSEAAEALEKVAEESKEAEEAAENAGEAAKEAGDDIGGMGEKVWRAKEGLDGFKTSTDDVGDAVKKASNEAESFGNRLKNALTQGRSFSQTLKDTLSPANALTKAFSELGTVLAGNVLADAVVSLGRKLWDVAKESVKLASNLEEVQNVVDVTFGDNASDINAWARSAKSAFGMSELNAKRFSGTIGAMMKSMGVANAEVQGMSTNLVALAGDMASFYNLDHETAFDKIRSGLAGEIEPLRQLGINMSVANLEAYALSEGITTAYEAMTEAERATLRYNYLMSVTADAQGDFARTSNNYANAVRTFGENIAEIKAGMGQSLLDFITPALTSFNAWYDDLTKTNTAVEQAAAKAEYEETEKQNQETYDRGEALIRTLEDLEGQTELTEAESYLWNKTLESLVQTFPDLKDVIDLTTGEIEGGTEALREYNKSWLETAQMDAKKILMERSQAAVTDAQTALYQAQANLAVGQNAVETAYANLYQGYRDASEFLRANGVDMLFDESSSEAAIESMAKISKALDDLWWKTETDEDANAVNRQIENLENLRGAIDTAINAIPAMKDAVNDANASFNSAAETYKRTAEYLGYTVEGYEQLSETERATAEARERDIQSIENATAALSDLEGRIEDITTYRAEAIGRARDQIDAALGGLDAVEDWRIAAEELDAYQTDMQEALNSQLIYLKSYQGNLDNLRQRGVDEELLNMLADGSVESAKTLQALAAMDEGELQGYLNTFGLVTTAKDNLAASVADTQLAVDEDFQAMVDAAAEAADAFDFSTQAATSLAATETIVDEWTQTMADEINRITAGVDAAKQALSEFGGVQFNTGEPDGSHASGLGYVPYDGYIAELHRGEEVLTAAEAAGRRQSESYAPAIDYDRIAEAASQRPVVVYVDRKAAAALLAREMDVQIGNRNIQQLVSMGG